MAFNLAYRWFGLELIYWRTSCHRKTALTGAGTTAAAADRDLPIAAAPEPASAWRGDSLPATMAQPRSS